MKAKLLVAASILVWGSAMAVALLAQINTNDSPSAQVNKPVEAPLARSQRCVGAECGFVPSGIASHDGSVRSAVSCRLETLAAPDQ
jgi:hypothetical protein